ncbi:hypothetical protein PN462_16980 [Spirulina sp. CS-785/01]|uniref:hypothetical protein n=1 Tax=Spirulina sp. CS-785/01 TaxID=3021716 RepID=UPI00232A949E|nr:hypothetical protein [Spirulina sp. CS-785/01]MDB9314810.1 hypothetical protein [Spirulina sp. CS-785/01]
MLHDKILYKVLLLFGVLAVSAISSTVLLRVQNTVESRQTAVCERCESQTVPYLPPNRGHPDQTIPIGTR